jgi:hypothetical protein
VDPGQRGDFKLFDVADVLLHEPFVAVVASEYTEILVAALDGRRGNDRVDAGRGPAANEDGERLRAHGAFRSNSCV